MNPSDNEELYRSLVIGDRVSPGVVTLSGHDRGHNWDIKTTKGVDGATTSYVGAPPGEFVAAFSLTKDYTTGEDQFADWDTFQIYLESLLPGPEPKAAPIYHPDLARQHYSEITVSSIGGMVHSGNGVGTVTVKFLEYKPPKKKPVKSASAKAGSSTQKGKDDPNAARKAEVDALTKEWQTP